MDAVLMLEELWALGDVGVVSTHRLGDAAVVRLIGEHDVGTAAAVRTALEQSLSAPAAVVVADLTDCSFMDCAVLGVLAAAHAVARSRGATLLVAESAARPLRLMSLTAPDRLWGTAVSVEAALATA